MVLNWEKWGRAWGGKGAKSSPTKAGCQWTPHRWGAGDSSMQEHGEVWAPSPAETAKSSRSRAGAEGVGQRTVAFYYYKLS